MPLPPLLPNSLLVHPSFPPQQSKSKAHEALNSGRTQTSTTSSPSQTQANHPSPPQRRRIDLPNDDLSAAGSVLEYLYNGEYFPRRLSASKDAPLEPDPSLPSPDNTGAALLQHAKVYTLADKLGLPVLKSLAHAKIHRTSSTARGEIAYARYVYKETNKEDVTIRRPVAAFWATRSHVLRHEAEDEFRAMCLEFPQFGFDVLSLVLDQREKKGERGHAEPAVVPGSAHGRKRARVSQG